MEVVAKLNSLQDTVAAGDATDGLQVSEVETVTVYRRKGRYHECNKPSSRTFQVLKVVLSRTGNRPLPPTFVSAICRNAASSSSPAATTSGATGMPATTTPYALVRSENADQNVDTNSTAYACCK